MPRTNNTIKIDKAREIIDRMPTLPNGNPTPSLALARILCEENPLLFKDVEDARSKVRRARGKSGEFHRKTHGKKEYFIKEDMPLNPYSLPESYTEKREQYDLPKACNKILLLADTHFPYHDIAALTAAMDYGVKDGINTIDLLGDVMDMHKGSKYQQDPRKRSIKQEFEATEQFLSVLREAFPTAQIYWQKGNHDIRWEKYLLAKSPEIFDDSYFHLEDRLRLIDKRVKILDDKTVVRAGKMHLHHGHLIVNSGFGGPIYPAKTLYDKTGLDYTVGHFHTVSTYKKIRKGAPDVVCNTLGCLSELNPDYNPIVNRYEHGFGHLLVDSDGTFEMRNLRVGNGKVRG